MGKGADYSAIWSAFDAGLFRFGCVVYIHLSARGVCK